MNKALYYLRVFFISFEFVALLAVFSIYTIWGSDILYMLQGVRIDDEALKWLVAYPISLVIWVLKEGVGILFPDDKSNRVLHEWPGYWKLKAHFDVGLFYAITLSAICVLVWSFDKLKSIEGAWLFVGSSLALTISAYSFFAAKISLKSALIHLNGTIGN